MGKDVISTKNKGQNFYTVQFFSIGKVNYGLIHHAKLRAIVTRFDPRAVYSSETEKLVVRTMTFVAGTGVTIYLESEGHDEAFTSLDDAIAYCIRLGREVCYGAEIR